MNVNWMDADTEDELEAFYFPEIEVCPRVGEEVHYWQDGDEKSATGEPRERLDFVVTRIMHDLRFMPARQFGSEMRAHTVVIWVRKVTP